MGTELRRVKDGVDIFEWVRASRNPFSRSVRVYRKCVYGEFGSICGALEVERDPMNNIHRSFWFTFNGKNYRLTEVKNMKQVEKILTDLYVKGELK